MSQSRIKIFRQYLLLAVLVVLVRTVFRVAFDEFSQAATVAGIVDGLKLSFWILLFGILNLIFDFGKLALRLPGWFGSALAISLSLVPEQLESVKRIRFASSLRTARKGFGLWRSLIAPTLADAVDRSITMAASMEARGFGSNSKPKTSGIALCSLEFSYLRNLPVFSGLDFQVGQGEFVLITGGTGTGKSTLLRLCNGLVPHFTGGIVNQRLERPANQSRQIAYVDQQPHRSFVSDSVAGELAFAPKQRGFSKVEIADRIQSVAAQFGLGDLLDRDPRTLSAGWQQRVAIAAALTSGARTLLLDEPFANLDEAGSRQLVYTLTKLKSEGFAIVVAEHRSELLLPLAGREFVLQESNPASFPAPERSSVFDGTPISFAPVTVRFGSVTVLQEVRVELSRSSINVLTGENGSGKTSLLRELSRQGATLVPQPASDLLFLESVCAELTQADRDTKQPSGTALGLLNRLGLNIPLDANPSDLSVGQKLALAIAIQMTRSQELLMLDEPTVGFDDDAKARLANLLIEITKTGTTVLIATHDEVFAEKIASRKLVLEGGVVRG